MLLTIQFPFADARAFVPNTKVLELPSWSYPEHEFVRNFGAIRYRKKGGLEGWVGENEICEARKVFEFKKDLSIYLHGSSKKTHLRCIFKRLYFDGLAVGKFEVGLRLRRHLETHLKTIDAKEFIDHALGLPIKFRLDCAKKTDCELIHAGKGLANSYRLATTQHPSSEGQSWWVEAGSPILFLEYQTDNINFPYFINPVLQKDLFQLSWCLIPYRDAHYRLWLLKIDPQYRSEDPFYDVARSLRITLLRLNAEHECLRIILRHTEADRIDNLGDKFQHYLNEATGRITKLENSTRKNSNDDVVDLARQAINKIQPGEQEKVESKIKAIRLNIRRKEEAYANKDKNTPTANPVNLVELANQLADLYQKIDQFATATNKNEITSAKTNLESAEQEARKGNGEKTIMYLSKVGTWVLNIASTIGTSVLIDALKIALKIPI